MLANAGGVSGGSILIAFIIIFNKFDSKTIASMNAFYNFVSALIRFLLNINQKNPVKANKTIIDYDIVAVILPLNILGSVLGGIFNVIFPNVVIDLSLIHI